MTDMTNQPTDNNDESFNLFLDLAELLDEHGLESVLEEISVYCSMKAEDRDNCQNCRDMATIAGIEIDRAIELMNYVDKVLGRCPSGQSQHSAN